MSDDTTRLAVLIDADNISAKVAKDVFEELAGYGTLTVKRAYGDWTTSQLHGWKEQLHAHAIAPMQQFAYTVGKNSTDSALIIDAMDLLYAGHLDGFVLVSSDSDFTRLATRLRESGMTVYGVGAKKTPRAFRDACDKFTFLEVLREDATVPVITPEVAAPEASAPEPTLGLVKGNLESMLAKALNKTATDDDWSALGSLGSHLNRTDPSFDPRTYGFAKLSDLVKAQPYLETRTVSTPSGQGQLWVRLKRRASAQKSAAEPAKKAARETTQQTARETAQETTQETTRETTRKTARKTAQKRTAPTKKATAQPPEEVEESAVEAPAEPAKKAPARRRTTRKVGQASGGGGV
ncbi:MAG: NYN domain-containing protein [Nocardioides sp.]